MRSHTIRSLLTRRRTRVLASALGALALLVGMAVPAFANLSGSTFEGNDGNLVVNTAGNTDWANAPNRVTGIDQPTGKNDNSFGQGTKEDVPDVSVVTGSIPPNKNDLTRFYIASEFTNGKNFVYLGWERLVNIGNANLDFEINQNTTAGFTGTTTGPVTLNRTAGDVLITYDFSGSGTPTLGLVKWLTAAHGDSASDCFSANTLPCWGANPTDDALDGVDDNRINLSAAGFAEGAVNTGTASDPIANLSLTTGLFGEAAVNLTGAGVFPAGTCEAFGSTFLKSRSSSSFTAEVKDFIAPVPVNISNCGEINIIKHTDPRGVNQTFSYTSTIAGASLDCSTDTTPASFSLNDNGNTTGDNQANTEHCAKVPVGSYTVTEGAEPANFVLESLTCTAGGTQDGANPAQANITVTPGAKVTCTYTNKQQLGAIKITKTSTKSPHPGLDGATFSISSNGSPIVGSPFTTANGGTICVDHLPFGTYAVQETAAPNGYKIDDTTAHNVSVSQNSTCGDGQEATFSATDTPLSQITVSFHSKVAGATSATIQCTGDASAQDLPDGTPRTLDDLVPGTYTCTVVIDP
jgi:Prealbumin-like fold domain